MVAHIVDGMAGFLYRKHKSLGGPGLEVRIYYNDYPERNDFFDEQHAGYNMDLEE